MALLSLPNIRSVIDGVLYLFFPSLCSACNRALPNRSQTFCLSCVGKLAPSLMCMHKQNAFTERMYGKVALHTGAALYLFSKGGTVQKVVHRLKYKNQPELGVKTGEIFGRLLGRSEYYTDVDIIIAVPLHPKKEKERGYNQSGAIAEGIANTTHIKESKHVLLRQTHRASQTHLGRLDRYTNVHEVYYVANANTVKGKHVLLVDDVLTTGATIATCIDLLLRAGAAKVSAVTLAIAV
jgi:ComF family protein